MTQGSLAVDIPLLTSVIETLRILNTTAKRNLGSAEIVTLLVIAQAPGPIPQSQLEKRVGITGAGVSRVLTRLGAGNSTVSGLGLIETADDYPDRRHKLISLTASGKDLMACIHEKAAYW